jgi:hypothetical protein
MNSPPFAIRGPRARAEGVRVGLREGRDPLATRTFGSSAGFPFVKRGRGHARRIPEVHRADLDCVWPPAHPFAA